MNKPWKVILVFTGVFLAGAVFGGFLSLRLARHFMENVRSRGPMPMEHFAPQIFQRLAERLELTAEQQEKIRPIIKETEAEMRRLRQTSMRESMAVAERMHEQVAALLTPEQKTKLEAMKREMRERWTKDRMRRMGDRPLMPPSEEEKL